MSRIAKFSAFTLGVMVFFVGEIFYVSQKEPHLESKLEFIKLTSSNSFAFYINTPYLRHQFGHDVSDIFVYHPAFRESDLGSFINSGYEKRFRDE